jgi:hypothetical protein
MTQLHGRAGKHLALLMAGLVLLVATSAAATESNVGDQSGCAKGDFEFGSSSSECDTVYVARLYN